MVSANSTVIDDGDGVPSEYVWAVLILSLLGPCVLVILYRWVVIILCWCCGGSTVGIVQSQSMNPRVGVTRCFSRHRWDPRADHGTRQTWIVFKTNGIKELPTSVMTLSLREGLGDGSSTSICCGTSSQRRWGKKWLLAVVELPPEAAARHSSVRLRYCANCCCIRAVPAPSATACRGLVATIVWTLLSTATVAVAVFLLVSGTHQHNYDSVASNMLLLIPGLTAFFSLTLCCCCNCCGIRYEVYPTSYVPHLLRELKESVRLRAASKDTPSETEARISTVSGSDNVAAASQQLVALGSYSQRHFFTAGRNSMSSTPTHERGSADIRDGTYIPIDTISEESEDDQDDGDCTSRFTIYVSEPDYEAGSSAQAVEPEDSFTAEITHTL